MVELSECKGNPLKKNPLGRPGNKQQQLAEKGKPFRMQRELPQQFCQETPSQCIHTQQKNTTRSSSREVRIRVPFFLESILVGEPSQPKKG